MTFGQKLKVLRKEHNYSQEEVAQRLDVSRQAVSKWESDRGIPEIDKLVQISTMFGVTLDYLMKTDYTEEDNQSNGYYVSREMIDGFLLYKRRGAKRIAIGVCLLLLSNVFINLHMHNQLSMIGYWMMLAAGAAVLIWHLFQQNHYKEIGTKKLIFDETTQKEFRNAHEQNRKRYCIMIIMAAIIFIMSSPVFCSFEFMDVSFAMALFWFLQAVSLSLVILAGSALHAERILAQNTEYMDRKGKQGSNWWIYSALPVTAFAVVIGIFTKAWSPFVPVIVLFCALLITVCKLLLEGKNKNE
ncbi:MAG: hypothetical protein PWP24_1521 [Clostridiales bacterium]|nr:hypothetical protein [Clostridiales bacterium]